ncbi:MAG: hypothetical protein Ct9H300mP12_10340 [Acidimicrobiales bacterium]|nr:MAG: hypothetical protein Ct9H300mP12_10340 [Acidimicrobiales bacterium]
MVITRFEVDRAIAWGFERPTFSPPSAMSTATPLEPIDGGHPGLPRLTTGPRFTQIGRRPSTPFFPGLSARPTYGPPSGFLARTVAPGAWPPGCRGGLTDGLDPDHP